MKKLYILMTSFLLSITVIEAKSLVKVKAIGSSPRGQYIAFEEYGYRNGQKKPFSKIRVMNVWKSKYVENTIQVIANGQEELSQVRLKAKKLASKKLKKFNIAM